MTRQSDAPRSVLLLAEDDSIWNETARAEVAASRAAICRALQRSGFAVRVLSIGEPRQLTRALAAHPPAQCLVFNWYDGAEWGAQDAAHVAALLEDLGYTYTGSDARALLMAQDKTRAKQLLCAHGIATPAWQFLVGDELRDWTHYPSIIKIATEHGSEWLNAQSVVHDERSLRAHVAALRQQTLLPLMVSQYIDGREITASLWGNGTLELLPLLEIDYSNLPPDQPRIRTFETKQPHAAQAPRYRVPSLPAALRAHIEQSALHTFRALGLRDYGRIDFRLDGGQAHVIDVNANPDLAGDSSFVYAAQLLGYNYDEMIGRIVRLALERAEPRTSLQKGSRP